MQRIPREVTPISHYLALLASRPGMCWIFTFDLADDHADYTRWLVDIYAYELWRQLGKMNDSEAKETRNYA